MTISEALLHDTMISGSACSHDPRIWARWLHDRIEIGTASVLHVFSYVLLHGIPYFVLVGHCGLENKGW